MPKSMFDLVVSKDKAHEHFLRLMEWPGAEPARTMLDKYFITMDDPDGNFLEQFQTTGFNQRYFEIYLYAYLHSCGFDIDRTNHNPDFIVNAGHHTVAIEATTSAPSQSGVLAKHGKKIEDLSYEELKYYQNEELPIRLGGPLFSKLKKKYWEENHCKNIPFVIAIEAFHDEGSLSFSDSALTQYLYGFRQTGRWESNGTLELINEPIEQHKVADKVITSGFFNQPEVENLSAVLFTNSGTNAKFQRMGYQHGILCDKLIINRRGFCINPDPNAMDPTFFSYGLSYPPFIETWGQGLVVLHNPNAKNPLPKDFFPDSVEGYMKDGKFYSDLAGWHPLSSMSLIAYNDKGSSEMHKEPHIFVYAISKEDFMERCNYAYPAINYICTEEGWFSDNTGSFLGVLTQDKTDKDWGYVILALDSMFRFRMIDCEVELQHRDEARIKLQSKIASLLHKGQRIFDQVD